MDAYTLKKRKDTNELHLFKGEMTENSCTSGSKSICEKMLKSESAGNQFQCETESEARKLCADIGRSVCGICVSHLYASFD